MTTQTATVVWNTIEFTKRGAESRYIGTDFEKARSLYDSLENATFVEIHGRTETGELIPGVMSHNLFLGRKLHGIEQLDK